MQIRYITYNPEHQSASPAELERLISQTRECLSSVERIASTLSVTSPQVTPLNSYYTSSVTSDFADRAQEKWVFIDEQNMFKSLRETGWLIDWRLFSQYLKNVLGASRLFVFIGKIASNQPLYDDILSAGFEIEFKPTIIKQGHLIKGGNVDPDLSSFVADYKNEFDKAILVADDFDYHRTVRRLVELNKLDLILSPHAIERTSSEIKKLVPDQQQIISLQDIRSQVQRSYPTTNRS